MTEISRLIRQLSNGPNDERFAKPAKVISVNQEARTCVVEPFDGSAKVYNVRLQSAESLEAGFVAFPKIGSSVLVVFLNKSFAFVALAGDLEKIEVSVDSIVINGGENGGVVKVSDMVATLNELIGRFNDMRTYISTHVHGGSGTAPVILPTFGPLEPVEATTYENQKVKH